MRAKNLVISATKEYQVDDKAGNTVKSFNTRQFLQLQKFVKKNPTYIPYRVDRYNIRRRMEFKKDGSPSFVELKSNGNKKTECPRCGMSGS